MKLEAIFELWDVDSKIDPSNVGNVALEVSQLHNKYYKILVNERLVLRKYEAEYKELRLSKQEFFIMGPTEETHAKGWQLPPCGKVLRSDVASYIEADKDIISLTLKIGIQKEKVSLLEDILKSLHNRNFNIKSYLDHEKIKNGIV